MAARRLGSAPVWQRRARVHPNRRGASGIPFSPAPPRPALIQASPARPAQLGAHLPGLTHLVHGGRRHLLAGLLSGRGHALGALGGACAALAGAARRAH